MEPAIMSDTFGADVVNILLLRPVWRKPSPKPEPKPEARQEHPEIPNGSRVRINTPMRPMIHGQVAVVDAYWPLAEGGPVITALPAGAPHPGVYYFHPSELTVETEGDKLRA